MEHIVLRYEIIINKSKKEIESDGNIWYKLSKNRHKRKNILLFHLLFKRIYVILVRTHLCNFHIIYKVTT